MTADLVSQDHRIASCRGMVITHNERGASIPFHDIARVLRFNRLALKGEKVDVLVSNNNTSLIPKLLSSAHEVGLKLSLRTGADAPPPSDLHQLSEAGLFDVLLTPTSSHAPGLSAWLKECRKSNLSIRLQLPLPWRTDTDPEDWAQKLSDQGDISAVQFAAADPFVKPAQAIRSTDLGENIEWARKAVNALEKLNIEAGIRHLPFCAVDKSSWANIINTPQRRLDHNDYIPAAWELNTTMWKRSLLTIGMISRALLSRSTLHKEVVDTLMVPWLLRNSYLYLLGRIYRRFTLKFDILNRLPDETNKKAIEEAQQRADKKRADTLGNECAQCALRTICDTAKPTTHDAIPGVKPKAIPGDHVVSPLHFSQLQPKHYDNIDAERRDWEPFSQALADEAVELVTSVPPEKIFTSADYGVEGSHFDKMEAGVKWWSITHSEKVTTPLGEFTPPLTISVDVGAGIADYFGFSFGRHCKIVCPMEAYRHHYILHITAEGQYVLVRDRHLVHPSEFEGELYLPLRLGNTLQPRLSAWNIDNCIATTNLKIWTDHARETESLDHIKYSIIIVSTKFTRRLQAVIRNLAHQENFDLSTLEVIICYVPGIDATDDLIDSVTETYPKIRFVRSPFPEKYMRSKGFLINESAKLVHGEWIMLLDSDTLLPPDYFARIEAVSDTENFIAPDGRRLLPPDITSKILMGEINPWEHWDELMSGDGEFRHRETHGIPVGFCQCFRTEYLEKFPYVEVDHFETADMHFGMQMLQELKQEYRMSGRPVLHLDHGGSQWYGAQKHM